ncbi:MAG: recombinase family protein [Oscillospiraceae bacterium]|nr:recombinase family protein [Oscillospiraceae bacterium]
MTEKITRAGCYVRVSTENQLENYSVEEQAERLKAYCSAKGWEVYRIYTDGGFSGGNTERPALKQMIIDAHNRKIDMVIVYKLDRLSRSQKDTLTLIEDEFLNNGVEFASMSENFDTSSPLGRAMIGILSVFAQLEKDQITERFTMGRIGRSKAGRYHGGPTAPTGYGYADGKLTVDEYKAMQVREVFDRFLAGYGVNSIQRHMRGKYGGWASHTLVLNVLRNTVYIGKVKFMRKTYDGIHEPIIAENVFHRAQALLSSRDAQKTPPQKTPFRAGYLLTSLVYCGRCGAKYSGNHGYYKCYSRSKSDKKYILDPSCKNKNWEIAGFDGIITGEIAKLGHDPKYIDSFKKEEPDTKALNGRLKTIDAQISKLIGLYLTNGMPDISSRLDALNEEKNALLKTLSAPADEAGREFAAPSAGAVFRSAPIEEKRMFVSSVIKSVIVDGGQVIINWRI